MSPKKKVSEEQEEMEEMEETPVSGNASYSILDLAADDIEKVVGFTCLPEGEYTLELGSLSAGFTKNRNPRLLAQLVPMVESEERIGNILHNMNLPYQGCKKTARDFFNDELAAFRLAFGIDASSFVEVTQLAFQSLTSGEDSEVEFNIEDFNGLTAIAIVEIEEAEGYGDRNSVKRFIIE